MSEQSHGEIIQMRHYYFGAQRLADRAQAIFAKPLHERSPEERGILDRSLPIGLVAAIETLESPEAVLPNMNDNDVSKLRDSIWNSAWIVRHNLASTADEPLPSLADLGQVSGLSRLLAFIASHQYEISHTIVLDRERQIIVDTVLRFSSNISAASGYVPAVAYEVISLANEADKILFDANFGPAN